MAVHQHQFAIKRNWDLTNQAVYMTKQRFFATYLFTVALMTAKQCEPSFIRSIIMQNYTAFIGAVSLFDTSPDCKLFYYF